MKIMTVDDSRVIRKLISQAIRLVKAEPVEAEDGRQALEILARDPGGTSLILMDWNMPIMSGIECLEALKADPAMSRIPVMMVTTHSESSRVAEALRKGAINYVAKPFTGEEMAAKILECLGLGT